MHTIKLETSKKRKLANEGRLFNENQLENYFMMEDNGKQVIAVMKEYNV